VPFLKIRLAVAEFNRGELAPQDLHEEIAAPARRFQKARVNALGFVFHKIEHRLYHPRRGKDFPMLGNALFGPDVIHGVMRFR